jgi:hypothetical protein
MSRPVRGHLEMTPLNREWRFPIQRGRFGGVKESDRDRDGDDGDIGPAGRAAGRYGSPVCQGRDPRRTNVFGSLLSLHMLVATRAGFDYTGADCRRWLAEAGSSATSVSAPSRSPRLRASRNCHRVVAGSPAPVALGPATVCARALSAS